MKIGLIDADFIGRKNHKFPNLALMKISTHFKNLGNIVHLMNAYTNIDMYDYVIVSKVFTDTPCQNLDIFKDKIIYGGSGFNNTKFLPYEIEHSKPDYTLYNNLTNEKYYTKYSIGFLTRGCFRKCDFCINKKYDKPVIWSDIDEFVDYSKTGICLLDDNFLAYGKHRVLLQQLIDINKKFQFKQGLDIRLLRHDTAEMLTNCKYDGDYIFAFDNIKDYSKVEHKLDMWRSYTHKNTKFYLLTAYESQDVEDIKNLFIRIHLLMEYKCIPYIMRYNSYKNSKFEKIYTNVARWCNQPNFYKKMSFYEFCKAHGENSGAYKTYCKAVNTYPELKQYFNYKF